MSGFLGLLLCVREREGRWRGPGGYVLGCDVSDREKSLEFWCI